MNQIKQWFQALKAKLTEWALHRALKQLVSIGSDRLANLPWEAYGQRLNAYTDAKFSKAYADSVQQAVASGLERVAKGLRA